MAPKGKRKAAPPKAASAASSSKRPADDDDVPLLDLCAGSSRKRRQLGRRDSDETVERSISKHFGGFSKIDLETVKVSGQVLRDRIRTDRHALPTGARLGSTYWRDLVQEWSSINAGIGSLRPTVKDYWALNETEMEHFLFIPFLCFIFYWWSV